MIDEGEGTPNIGGIWSQFLDGLGEVVKWGDGEQEAGGGKPTKKRGSHKSRPKMGRTGVTLETSSRFRDSLPEQRALSLRKKEGFTEFMFHVASRPISLSQFRPILDVNIAIGSANVVSRISSHLSSHSVLLVIQPLDYTGRCMVELMGHQNGCRSIFSSCIVPKHCLPEVTRRVCLQASVLARSGRGEGATETWQRRLKTIGRIVETFDASKR